MQEGNKIEEFTASLEKYVTVNYELIKLEAVERSSVIGSGIISGILVGLAAILFVFFISIGIAFYLSDTLGYSYSGFVIVAGFYFLTGLILIISRKKMLVKPLRDKIIRKVFSKN